MPNEITREVEAAVRSAARSAGGYRGELSGVYRRARRRRTRQALLAGAAILAVLVGGGAIVRRSAIHASPQPAANLPDYPQRLLLSGVDGTYGTAVSSPVLLSPSTLAGEILPDGTLKTHPVVGVQAWQRYVELPDGRIVALATQDTADTLFVVGASGRVVSAQNIRDPGWQVDLLTASETTAYLWRPEGLIARDLDTEVETVAMTSRHLDVEDVFDGTILAADAGAGELAVDREKDPCQPYVLRLGSGSTITAVDLTVPGWDCAAVVALRLSPDGSKVAGIYRTDTTGYRLFVARTDVGAVVADQVLSGSGTDIKGFLAWADDVTVRGVLVPTGAGSHRLDAFAVRG